MTATALIAPTVPTWWMDAEEVFTHHVEGFAPRTPQRELVAHMWDTFGSRGHSAVEAKVGTGKSWAALLTASQLRSRTVISTATRALQAQYRTSDVPMLISLGLLDDADVVVP